MLLISMTSDAGIYKRFRIKINPIVPIRTGQVALTQAGGGDGHC